MNDKHDKHDKQNPNKNSGAEPGSLMAATGALYNPSSIVGIEGEGLFFVKNRFVSNALDDQDAMKQSNVNLPQSMVDPTYILK